MCCRVVPETVPLSRVGRWLRQEAPRKAQVLALPGFLGAARTPLLRAPWPSDLGCRPHASFSDPDPPASSSKDPCDYCASSYEIQENLPSQIPNVITAAKSLAGSGTEMRTFGGAFIHPTGAPG